MAMLTCLQTFSTGCAPVQTGAHSQSLPNEGFLRKISSSALLTNVIKAFPADRASLGIDGKALEWPLSDPSASLLTRFGTPTIAIESKGKISAKNFDLGYLHDALDIKRSSQIISDSIHSPMDGIAVVVGQNDADPYAVDDPYDSAIVILDEETQLVVGLLHAVPDPKLFFKKGSKIRVKKGETIGRLAEVSSLKRVTDKKSFAHVHVFAVAPDRGRYINPAPLFPKYRDSVAPIVKEAYALNSKAVRARAPFQPGKYDIVLVATDRDGQNQSNFEINSVEFSITNSQGTVLKTSRKCGFDNLTGSLSNVDITVFLDLGNSRGQVTDSWVSGFADADNPNRLFRYVLTHLDEKSGDCTLKPSDEAGYLSLSSPSESMRVKGQVWDWAGNVTAFDLTVQ
jgi:hypothetical protein